MAKVTGYGLKEIIKKLERRRDTAKSQFEEALYYFEGETTTEVAQKRAAELAKQYEDLERKIARVQSLQAEYNASVTITIQDGDHTCKYTLSHAIKLLGGAERIEKLWQKATSVDSSGGSRYYSPDRVRVAGQEHAKRAISTNGAIMESEKASTFVGALRAAVAVANSTEKEMALPEGALLS
jgi:DNA-binding transcriptional MerR regulator